MAEHPDSSTQERLLLEGPSDVDATKLDVQTENSVKLDTLGPMVVNSDGTLSRIANWAEMTEPERARTLRVLSARNKIRIAEQEEKQNTSTECQKLPTCLAFLGLGYLHDDNVPFVPADLIL
ncbi:hypothetical protein H0H81_008294 [Sphagnurus paluster]|uniref:Uncharacterized protein n=1 Tax=Sphagnurus paluster TaxID=117069 RepID=A0A9P7GQZ4_9AGAR|nr:hypothetical protein H0H81_008294 [Sphagnurus paluster]